MPEQTDETMHLRWWCDPVLTTYYEGTESREWLIMAVDDGPSYVASAATYALAEHIVAAHNATVTERNHEHG